MTTLLTTLVSLVLLTAGIASLWIVGAGILTFVLIIQAEKVVEFFQKGQQLTVWQLPRIKIAFAVAIG